MKKATRGLYTNGKQVAVLYDQWCDGTCDYERLLPARRYGLTEKSYEAFLKKYPVRVTKVEVEQGAEKEKKVSGSGIYTSGKNVVATVQRVGNGMVNYVQDLPFRDSMSFGGTFRLAEKAFLKKYPYRLDAVELIEK